MNVNDAISTGQTPGTTGPRGGNAVRSIDQATTDLGNGLRELVLSVPGVHCGACIRVIETGLGALSGISVARVNLSQRRIRVIWNASETSGDFILARLEELGFKAHLPDTNREDAANDARYRGLLLALAVSGFAAGNIMLLSISVWSGADASTRDLFHWISALIAIPAVAVAGRPFFSSAGAALVARRLNMDVPISLAVILALTLSVFETSRGGPHAYFDAVVTLLFFLLIGRTLNHLMRRRSRGAAAQLSRLAPHDAILLQSDGTRTEIAVSALRVGDRVLIRSGDRVPVDGITLDTPVIVDAAMVSGESAPVSLADGEPLNAGMLNRGTAFHMQATAIASDSFIAEITRLMEAVEGAKTRYRRLSDRAAGIYAPTVHIVAGLTFLFWWLTSGDLHRAAYTAIAVLIITCPCALALAIPTVQAAASNRLFRIGVLLKDGDALERLSDIDHVVLDKTGTLTDQRQIIANSADIDDMALALAAALAAASAHPRAQAIRDLASARGLAAPIHAAPREYPGYGLELVDGDRILRLGRADWAVDAVTNDAAGDTILAVDGMQRATFRFVEVLRPGARMIAADLATRGLDVEMLSGDHQTPVRRMADTLGIPDCRAGMSPAGKLARLDEIAESGRKALMVGDGLNDGLALSAAHASIAPSEASDVGRSAADLVFLGRSLGAVTEAIDIARKARALMRQNLVLTLTYNLVAVPIAVTGLATPLVAAIAMSLSSVVVTANAMRLALMPVPTERGDGS